MDVALNLIFTVMRGVHPLFLHLHNSLVGKRRIAGQPGNDK